MEGNVNFDYYRVLPRDLFNESKLLKCLGQLSLLIHDGKIDGVQAKDSGKPFRIGLHDAGYLIATGGACFKKGKQTLWLGTNYNSMSPYPLVCMVDYDEIEVFRDNGEITDEFREFIETK